MEKTLTTQQIADDLNAWVGTIRAAALRVFPRSEMVYDMNRKGFVFTEEQAERIKAEFTKGEDKKEKVLIGNNRKDLMVKEESNVSEKNLMTTKELAKTIGVSERTIRETAKNKGVEGTFHTLKTNGGSQSVKMFTEQQATLIKQEIEKHHNLKTRQIDSVTTQMEVMQKIQDGYALAVQMMNDIRHELNKRSKKLRR